MPTISLRSGITPYEQWYDRKPDVNHFRVFSCSAYSHVPDVHCQKLDKKAQKFIFVGYSTQAKGYRLFDETTSVVYIRRDVTFTEADFGHSKKSDTRNMFEIDNAVSKNENECDRNENQQEQRKSTRYKSLPTRYDIDEYADTAISISHTAYSASQVTEPSTLKEAMESSQSNEWKQATDQEYQSLMKNKTWELVELPPDRKMIGCKWVFKVKHGQDARVERFKSRLVAKGYSQTYGVDYDDRFSPVVRFSSIRTLFVFALQNNFLIHQMDVVTTFLNGTLQHEIYMEQAEGYIQPGKEHLVCKLKGVKQSLRCWNATFRDHMESIGYSRLLLIHVFNR